MANIGHTALYLAVTVLLHKGTVQAYTWLGLMAAFCAAVYCLSPYINMCMALMQGRHSTPVSLHGNTMQHAVSCTLDFECNDSVSNA